MLKPWLDNHYGKQLHHLICKTLMSNCIAYLSVFMFQCHPNCLHPLPSGFGCLACLALFEKDIQYKY